MPQRIILHVDMNAYFASVEQAANPFLRGKPVAVGGGSNGKTTVIAACSYEAKSRGIKNAMNAWEARKICPDLVILPGDMNKYIYTSTEIMKMLREYTPLVEVFSIDEAFLDVTETFSRFGSAIAVAREIKRKIRERFHLTCSIGIGPNKLMAKLAGELKKPDGLVTLREEDIPDKIKDVPVKELCGVGSKLEKYLAEMGIKTFGDLHSYPREKLVKRFGAVYGEQLYYMGQGRDNSEVAPCNTREEAKSMGHSYTLSQTTYDMDEAKSYLLRLAEQVGRRLRQSHYKGNVVHVSLGFGNYQFWRKQKKLEDYVDDGYEIYRAGEKLIDQSFSIDKDSKLLAEKDKHGIRFVGICASNLMHNLDQASLFPSNGEKKKVIKAMDKVNDRYGDFTVERAAIMHVHLEKKSGMAPRENLKNATE